MVTSYTSNRSNAVTDVPGSDGLMQMSMAYLGTETAFLISIDALEPIAECNGTFYRASVVENHLNYCY